MALLKNGTRIHGFGVVEGLLSVGSIVTTNSTPLQIASSITRSSSNTTGTIVITNGGGLATRGNIYSGNIVITGAVNSNGITFTDNTRQTTSALEKSNTQTQSLNGSLIVGRASVNYLQFTGNTTSNGPVLSTEGTDTNIDINIRPKGIGAVNVETSGTSTFLNVRNPTALAILNVTASGSCTRSQIVTFASGNGSEANLLIYTTGAAGNPPASAKISSSTGKSTLQVEGGQSASINIVTLGASSTATANLQIRSGVGGSFSGDAGILVYGKTNSLKLIHTGTSSGSRFDMGGDSPLSTAGDFATANITSSLTDGVSSLRVIGGNRADFKLSANGNAGGAGTSGYTSFDVESIGTSINPVYANVSSTFGGVNVQILGAQAGGFAGFANMRMFARSTANLIIQSGSSGSTPGASLKIFGDGSAPSYANIGSTTSAESQVNIISSLPSTSNTTGALVVIGGVGVTGNLYVGGTNAGANGIYTDNLRYSANGQPWVMGSATNESQLAKAWVNFNGVSGVSVRASYNVSSVTRVSSGRYTITFTTAFVDANYAVVMYNSASTGTAIDSFNNQYAGGASGGRTTTDITVISFSASEVDSAFFDVVIFR